MFSGIVRNLMLMLADALCISACWSCTVLAYHVCGGGYEPAFYIQMWPVVPAFLAVNVLFRLYHGKFFYPAAPFTPVEEMRRLIGSSVFIHLGIIAFLALSRQTTEGYSRFVIVVSGLLTAALAQSIRNGVRWLFKRLNIGQIPIVLVGSEESLPHLVEMLEKNSYLGFRPMGYFGEQALASIDCRYLGTSSEVVDIARQLKVKALLIGAGVKISPMSMSAYSDWFAYIEYLQIATDFPVASSRIVSFDGHGGIEIVNQDRMALLRVEKWLLDKILALLAFLIASPFLLIIGALVVLTSPGGAFFRHNRLGRNGRQIRIWKFRTMYRDAEARLRRILAEDPKLAQEWNANFKLRNDPRITPLGRFLRKTSLDELPQLFNVLGGSMALVGPRPIVEAEKAYYGDNYATFASVKPGVTGLWQVTGRSETNYARRVALDVYYVQNWSPWLDIWILFRTFVAVLTMRGAR